MASDIGIKEHQQWLGYLQPEGLVVSAQVLVDNQVYINRNSAPLQAKLQKYVATHEVADGAETQRLTDLKTFLTDFLGWPAEMLEGTEEGGEIPEALKIPLPEVSEILEPDFAFKSINGTGSPWMLLLKEVPAGADLDAKDDSEWSVSHAQRFERLLRDTQVAIGLLTNGEVIRLIYAPRGENSGSLTFSLPAMLEVAGRPITAAFEELLKSYRLVSAPAEVRLPALLSKSREYQASVSEALAKQVLDSLYELLRGFQAADNKSKGELLKDAIAANPDLVYRGLLSVLLRLVFLLFAEDRGLLPTTAVYAQHYSVHGLFERLRIDNEQFPDTMDARYGAWAQLLALFRAVCHGCDHPELKMPARKGYLFDPDRFLFFEGRTMAEPRIPLLSDGTIYRVLDKLLILKGERLSYRTLDVEQIGSVYETIMGFKLEMTTGKTIALKPAKAHGAPIAINLEDLMAAKGQDRLKWIQERTENKFTGQLAEAIKSAGSIDDALVALNKRIEHSATPHPLPGGSMILQPTDERRRSGSHYTPRSLTEPIVRKALEPILKRLGETPTPEQILDLKIADIAVGSGAFLVEACRQLAEELVKAWRVHKRAPPIPADEDEVLYARRAIAQRCLYAVDRNPMAANLAKLSLWLATLAKDHPFTFLDHSIRSGDSLVGLSKAQIAALDWDLEKGRQRRLGQDIVEKRIKETIGERRKILDGGDLLTPEEKTASLRIADQAIDLARIAGDLVAAAFFSGGNEARRKSLDELANSFVDTQREDNQETFAEVTRRIKDQLTREPSIAPFHWELEFPEVFEREAGGFDAIVGNPPFAGKNTLINGNRAGYLDWLKALHERSHGNSDVVAHFFRRAFTLLRPEGRFGLIATKTIRQGDTRYTGLRWICVEGVGTIYAARRRYKWTGAAAVIVSVVWVMKCRLPGPFDLDGKPAATITAYLFHDGGHESPITLLANGRKSFIGTYPLGMGFTFDDSDKKGVASPISEMHRIIAKDPRSAERIFPYIGGEEVNDSPTHSHHRYIIYFGDFPLRRDNLGTGWLKADEKQRGVWLRTGVVPEDYPGPVAADWPDLLEIVERKVKPDRQRQKDKLGRDRWWNFLRTRPEMLAAIKDMPRVLVMGQTSKYRAITFLPTTMVFDQKLIVFAIATFGSFAVLQSRFHDAWALFFGSTMKDDPVYTPSDCFETFPFPAGWERHEALEAAGQKYYDFRAALMVRNNEGLTATYNRFHDPEETSPDVLRLRELHAAMDRSVLNVYGWNDISTHCEFILDYVDEGEDEPGRSRNHKKPYRYRWLDEVRDEVLARLLKLNAERAEEERLTGLTTARASKTKPSNSTKTPVDQVDLL
jgi:hypothetical protein